MPVANWIEIENDYITNQPLVLVGSGKGRKRVPDCSVEPTEAYLFCYRCRELKRGIKRSRFLKVIKGENAKDLERAIAEEVHNKTLIPSPKNPLDYIKSDIFPEQMRLAAGAALNIGG